MTPYLTPLSVADLRALGIPEPWAFGQADRVRFYELDALGHVNNIAYLRWFETLRVSWAISRGITTYGPDDPTFVLKHVTCTYHAPMFLNDDYVVTARCESFRTSSFVKSYAVWSAGRLTVEGTAVGVRTNRAGTQKLPLTDAMQETLRTMDGARDEADDGAKERP